MIERELLFVRAGERCRGSIGIGAPRVVDDGEARCAIALDAPGLLRIDREISGQDPLQALLLAVQLLASVLSNLRDRGVALQELDGGRFPFEAYFGGLSPRRPTIRLRVRRSTKRRR
jgi:hypothetical protein